MRRHSRIVIAVALALGCSSEPTTAVAAQRAQAKQAATSLPEPADHHYGVYLNGSKVGWMRSTLAVGAEVTMAMDLEAAVGGMGQVSRIKVRDERSYDAASGVLTRLAFIQEAATGSVHINGKREGKELVLSISAGKATQTQRFSADTTLEDALAPLRMAESPKVGETRNTHHFDASLQKLVAITHKTLAVEDKMLAGVATRAVRVESTYPELGVSETTWLDAKGKVLESQVGGFFVARLEPPDVAKRLDFQQDILVSAVVKTPRPIKNPSEVARMSVRFSGFADQLPPSSERQKVSREDGFVRLELARDPPLPSIPLSAARKAGAGQTDALVSTPFIQSDSAEIRAAAVKAIGEATVVAQIIERLTAFVFTHVADEYVPAYSNALEALASGRGDCTEHSVLFVALARSLGLPARVAVGIAYWPPGNGFGWHAWAEVYAGDRWYTVDPTWNQPIADATHVKLADGGPAEQARIVMLLGRLKVEGLDP
jgi:hypothetical protein